MQTYIAEQLLIRLYQILLFLFSNIRVKENMLCLSGPGFPQPLSDIIHGPCQVDVDMFDPFVGVFYRRRSTRDGEDGFVLAWGGREEGFEGCGAADTACTED